STSTISLVQPYTHETAPYSTSPYVARKSDRYFTLCIFPASRYVPAANRPSAIDYNWTPEGPTASCYDPPVAPWRTPPTRAPSRDTFQPSASHQIPLHPYTGAAPAQKFHNNTRQSTELCPRRYSRACYQTVRSSPPPWPAQYRAPCRAIPRAPSL